MKCFYHSSDLDGKCSGAIIKNRYPKCEMFPINYGEDFPWENITLGETVFMVDFSLDVLDMAKLSNRSNLIWIDHHKTAIEAAAKVDLKIRGIQEVGIGACALVWDFIFPKKHFPEGRPLTVQLIAEHDVWDHSNPLTLPFQYGMRLKIAEPDSLIWPLVLGQHSDHAHSIISNGEIALQYEDQANEIYARAAFETELDGHRCIAINKMYANSKLFDSVFDESKHDAMLAFGWRHGKWTVSLYSVKVDVSKTAIKFGGGGHEHACGFACDELPFELGGDR